MKLFIRITVLVAFVLSLAFTAHAAEIKFGVAEALTGPVAKYGVPIKNGFVLAAEEINAAGGINGNKINLIVEDEQAKKEEAINVFKKFIFQDKVLSLVLPFPIRLLPLIRLPTRKKSSSSPPPTRRRELRLSALISSVIP